MYLGEEPRTTHVERLERGIAATVHEIDELRAENTRLRKLIEARAVREDPKMDERYEPFPDSSVDAWVEYRAQCGTPANVDMAQEQKAFMAGWTAAHRLRDVGRIR